MDTLIPVIEFAPGNYATQERNFPEYEDRMGWDNYWRRSLADVEIVELEPIQQASWFVATSQLTLHSTLQTMLEVQFEEVDEWDIEEIPPLPGGYVLRQDEETLLEPGCCGDLGDLREWRDACESREAQWQVVWIGHPWTHVSAVGERLAFLEPSEESSPKKANVILRVERQDLAKAIETASQEVKALAERLIPIVAELVPPDVCAKRVVQVLVAGIDG